MSGMGVHWYAEVEDRFDAFGELSKTHEKFPDYYILATEACTGYLPFFHGPNIGDWGRGEVYGRYPDLLLVPPKSCNTLSPLLR